MGLETAWRVKLLPCIRSTYIWSSMMIICSSASNMVPKHHWEWSLSTSKWGKNNQKQTSHTKLTCFFLEKTPYSWKILCSIFYDCLTFCFCFCFFLKYKHFVSFPFQSFPFIFLFFFTVQTHLLLEYQPTLYSLIYLCS